MPGVPRPPVKGEPEQLGLYIYGEPLEIGKGQELDNFYLFILIELKGMGSREPLTPPHGGSPLP